jgi:hypothetical protein
VVEVTFEEFHASLIGASPSEKLSPPLRALWWAENGNWHSAHKLVQDEETREAAWVHAYLHRVEGDIGNARYWYGQAGRPAADGDLAAEWRSICDALLK